MTGPRIGITGVTRHVQGADRSQVNAAYVRAVLGAGGVPLILPPLIRPEDAGTILDTIDGLVLSGGEDVDPAHFNSEPHPALGDVDPVRDAFELTLFRGAWDQQLPVLAICRGIQLVNVALGGTLWQDIPSERPGALVHRQDGQRDERHHPISIVAGSRLAVALGATTCEVNSFHHQSVRNLAAGLVVTATAPDGEIEGLEGAPGMPWLLAVQWHPEEFHADGSAPDQGLFLALIREARATASAPQA